ncbi:MAG TPA: GIY-YIG nuclease family protein [Thermoanaerobaculia bacterium]|nr:GIY-YIG nuclease family protein [Thermoanaerobaculia bacterium]
MHEYWVYIVSNRWRNVLYVGMTNSLERRIWEHRKGSCEGFTRRYNVTDLLYFERYTSVQDAIAREKQIKAWSRRKKESLIEGLNPVWSDLAVDWYEHW